MLLNEEIIKILENKNLDSKLYLTLMFGIEQKLDAQFFIPYKNEIKILIELNFIEFDNINEGFFKLKKSIWSSTINSLKTIVNNKTKSIIQSKTQVDKTVTIEVLEWLNEWLDLFPKGLNKIIGYDVHGNKNECHKRMSKFRKDNFEIYNKDIIIKATKLYLNEREKERWQYCKKNVKFIYDENGSMLENYCDRIIRNDYIDDDLNNNEIILSSIKHW